MSARALFIGTIAIDTLQTPQGRANSVLGGSGPYAALAARLLSADVELLGVIGSDFPAEFALALETRGLSLRHVERREGQTFAWCAEYEDDMNKRRTLSTTEGVQEGWQVQVPAALRAYELAVATNVRPHIQLAMLRQCEGARFSMSDFMKSWILREREAVDEILSIVDLALMNDEEACAFAGTDDSLEAGYALLAAGPRYAVVKHGSAGATLFHRTPEGETKLFRCPAWPLVRPKDPTGAGDAFMGALAGYLTSCLNGGNPSWADMKRGIAIATVVAASVCESFGMVSLFSMSRSELARRIELFYQMTHF